MYNDFVLIGPKSDPAGVKGNDVVEALKKLAAGKAEFISRGDKSGTHAAELRYWKAAGIDAPAGKAAGLQGMRLRHGPGAEHRLVDQRLRAGRPRHLAVVQEPRRPGHPGRRRQAAVQPVRRDRRQPGQAPAREEGPGAGLRRLGGVARRAGRRSPATRSAASSCSSRTPGSSGGGSVRRPAEPAGPTLCMLRHRGSLVLCIAPTRSDNALQRIGRMAPNPWRTPT